jgi:hypothetical protein
MCLVEWTPHPRSPQSVSSTLFVEAMAPKLSRLLPFKISKTHKGRNPEVQGVGYGGCGGPPDGTIAESGAETLTAAGLSPQNPVVAAPIGPQASQHAKTFAERTFTSPAASLAHRAPVTVVYIDTDDLPTCPEELWDRAYDSLKDDDPSLVEAYEKILSSEIRENGPPSEASEASEPQKNIIEQANPAARRTQMQKLIQDGLLKTAKEAKILRGASETIQVVLSAKDMIDSAMQTVPQAALAWTGICFAPQVRRRAIRHRNCGR